MKTLLLIMVMLMGFAPALLARIKRTTVAGAQNSENQNGGNDDAEDDFFAFDNLESEEASQAQQPYFTYEAPDAPEMKHEAQAAPAVIEPELLQPAFDLRQAVVYQTLLNNRYINQEN